MSQNVTRLEVAHCTTMPPQAGRLSLSILTPAVCSALREGSRYNT